LAANTITDAHKQHFDGITHAIDRVSQMPGG
jgi:hypothetical protein